MSRCRSAAPAAELCRSAAEGFGVAEVVHTLMSADGRFRVEVVRRPTGGYQLAYSRFHQEYVPDYGLVWEGWVSVHGRVTLTDSPERGAALAAEELALWERPDAEPGAAADGGVR